MAGYEGLTLQCILFGPPGCGKSFRVRSEAKSALKMTDEDAGRFIETTFHPEYSYSDFTAKLLPCSRRASDDVTASPIEYRIYAGPLLKALSVAYANPDKPVLLAIDEINRGNCAHIFGDVFQLLDRDADGWSEYGIDLCELFQDALEQELTRLGKKISDVPAQARSKLKLPPNLSILATMNTSDESVYYMDTAFKRRWDFLYMPWESDGSQPGYDERSAALIEGTTYKWLDLLKKLNAYIADKFIGRNVDDKQVGLWFLKSVQVPSQQLAPHLAALRAQVVPLIGHSSQAAWVQVFSGAKTYQGTPHLDIASVKTDFEAQGVKWPSVGLRPSELAATLVACIDSQPKALVQQISRASIANKLMFFLWDNVFTRDRRPLTNLLKVTAPETTEPRTFGEFASGKNVTAFIEGLMTWTKAK